MSHLFDSQYKDFWCAMFKNFYPLSTFTLFFYPSVQDFGDWNGRPRREINWYLLVSTE